jgi:hypothetical protein
MGGLLAFQYLQAPYSMTSLLLMYLGQVAVTVEQEMQLSRSGTGQSGCRREGLEAFSLAFNMGGLLAFQYLQAPYSMTSLLTNTVPWHHPALTGPGDDRGMYVYLQHRSSTNSFYCFYVTYLCNSRTCQGRMTR